MVIRHLYNLPSDVQKSILKSCVGVLLGFDNNCHLILVFVLTYYSSISKMSGLHLLIYSSRLFLLASETFWNQASEFIGFGDRPKEEIDSKDECGLELDLDRSWPLAWSHGPPLGRTNSPFSVVARSLKIYFLSGLYISFVLFGSAELIGAGEGMRKRLRSLLQFPRKETNKSLGLGQ